MSTHIAVLLPTETFVAVLDFLRAQGSDRDPVVAIEDAIAYWMENASWKQEYLLPETNPKPSRGYTWRYKETYLFLPQGTEVRMRYKDRYHYARVEEDEIIYEGETVSPSTLTRKIAGSSRNAWRDLWIKRPGESEWKLSDQCRRDAKEAEQKAMRELDQLLGLPSSEKPRGQP
jgi:hypothetical protein